MKRSDELAPLSREHHVALELALRLKRATVLDADEVRGLVTGFWDDEGRDHFRAEEDILLPAFARHAPADDPDVVRVLAEHEELRRRMDGLAAVAAPGPQALHELGALLQAHVRHEERALFPRIEAALSAAELGAVGAQLAAAGARHRPPRA